MDIEFRLKRYKEKKALVNTIEIRIEAYERMLAESDDDYFIISLPSELGMPRSPNRGGSSTEKAVTSMECDREAIKEIIKNEKSRLFWPKLEIEQIDGALKALTTWENYIIECKYFDDMSWRNIEINFNKQFPQRNDLTEGRLRQINEEGLKKLNPILKPFYNEYEEIFKKEKLTTSRRKNIKSPIISYKLAEN